LQNGLIQFANQTKWIWWPPPYLYATIFIVVVTAIRLRKANVLMLSLLSVLNSLVLLVLIGNPDFRFQYPVIVIGLVIPALMLAQVDQSSHTE
jgi:hypothetical protein